ncbi:MAG: tetratricopeptide repeat protein [Prevotella sp.]|nr:tetratricopeptide repeat protein [Prevotella sp.]
MDSKAIYDARRLLKSDQLGKALSKIETIKGDMNFSPLFERISKLQDDYQLMVDYWKKGYPDPQRDKLYFSLLRKLDRLTNDAILLHKLNHDMSMSGTRARMEFFDTGHTHVRQMLEGFVSDVALLEFETDPGQRTKAIYRAHLEDMTALFECLCFSMQWHADDAQFYQQLLLSPTIDSGDAAHLVSAISLAAMTHFDIHKYTMLAEVYRQASDERVRQRALVGWALTSTSQYRLYPEIMDVVKRMTEDENTARELLEMQMQMFFCMNAEHDHEEIQRSIIPNIIKNRGFDVTRMGIVEKDDDPMEDILHPEASDKAMEELEESMQRMMQMQQSGADIYFGGFSQMKRYPFFYNLSNWFAPFYVNHPGIETTMKKLKGAQFLENLLNNGPFCDSDKYSFALAMATVIDRLPENMKSMLDSEVAFGPVASDDMLHSPSSVRLTYLQDLYRFFRLCDRRVSFYNPFGGDGGINALFFAHPVFQSTPLATQVLSLGNFLLKRKQYAALGKLLNAYPETDRSSRYLILKGSWEMREGRYEEAMQSFGKALEEEPDNKKALSALARTALLAGEYQKAEEAFGRLTLLDENNPGYQLNQAIALIHNQKSEEAVKILYRLDYDNPGDGNVTRALAWALLASQKVEQAGKEYAKLLAMPRQAPEDFLNAGYCQWFSGNIEAAVDLFRKFLQQSGDGATPDLSKEFEKDKHILLVNGISLFEAHMMSDLLE